MRCFLAIDIPERIKNKCKKIQEEFKETEGNLNFVNYENMHFTVKFYGEVSEDGLNKLKKDIDSKLKNEKALEIELNGIGVFPDKNFIKVIWIGAKNLDNLTKKFNNHSPHLTIARVKSPKNKHKIQEKLEKLENVDIGKMKVDELTLYKSDLTPQGPVYTELYKFGLVCE